MINQCITLSINHLKLNELDRNSIEFRSWRTKETIAYQYTNDVSLNKDIWKLCSEWTLLSDVKRDLPGYVSFYSGFSKKIENFRQSRTNTKKAPWTTHSSFPHFDSKHQLKIISTPKTIVKYGPICLKLPRNSLR